MLHIIHDVPLWIVASLITIGAAVYSIGLMLVTRTLYGVDRLSLNNEVAGFKFAVIGVFYAVLGVPRSGSTSRPMPMTSASMNGRPWLSANRATSWSRTSIN